MVIKRGNTVVTVLIAFLLAGLVIHVFGTYFAPLPKFISQVNSTYLGAILTAIITVFLLSQQTSSEELKERNSKVFEEKIKIYDEFLTTLKKIISDNEISIQTDVNPHIDEVKDLIFQLASVKMHTEGQNVEKIFNRVNKIVDIITQYNAGLKDSEDIMLDREEYYNKLTIYLFEIVQVFQEELYKEEYKGKLKDQSAIDHKSLLENIASLSRENGQSATETETTEISEDSGEQAPHRKSPKFIRFENWEAYEENLAKSTVDNNLIPVLKEIDIYINQNFQEAKYGLKIHYTPRDISFRANISKRKKVFLYCNVRKSVVQLWLAAEGESREISKVSDFNDDIKKIVSESYKEIIKQVE